MVRLVAFFVSPVFRMLNNNVQSLRGYGAEGGGGAGAVRCFFAVAFGEGLRGNEMLEMLAILS